MLPKKLKDATIEDIQATLPDVFESIKALGKQDLSETLEAENQALKAENARLKVEVTERDAEETRKNKILEIGNKLNVLEKAQELINAGKTIEEATSELIDEASQQATAAAQGFEQTAPPAAGDASGDAGETEINTFSDAVEMVRKRDGSTKAEATRKAVEEFPKLHETVRKGGK